MTYYECIKPMTLFKAHEIKTVIVISEYPMFSLSAWLKVETMTGKTFYLNRDELEDMQKYPEWYPVEERRLFAPAQEDKK